MTRKSVASWVSDTRQDTLDALRHDVFKRERERIPDTIGGVAKVKAVYDSKPNQPDSLPSMPKGKVRTVLKAMPDDVRLRSADGKCARWTKTDAKVSEYVWHDYGQGNGPELVKREKLRLEALSLVMPERQPLVQRKPRTDGKKMFRDYRNERPAVVVTDKAGIRKA